jgi:hypothetical protein
MTRPNVSVAEDQLLSSAPEYHAYLEAFFEALCPGRRDWLATSQRDVYETRGPTAVLDGQGNPINRMLYTLHLDKPDRVLLTPGAALPSPDAIARLTELLSLGDGLSGLRFAWCSPVGMLDHPLGIKTDRLGAELSLERAEVSHVWGWMRIRAVPDSDRTVLFARWVDPDTILLAADSATGRALLPRYMLDIMALRPPTQEN